MPMMLLPSTTKFMGHLVVKSIASIKKTIFCNGFGTKLRTGRTERSLLYKEPLLEIDNTSSSTANAQCNLEDPASPKAANGPSHGGSIGHTSHRLSHGHWGRLLHNNLRFLLLLRILRLVLPRISPFNFLCFLTGLGDGICHWSSLHDGLSHGHWRCVGHAISASIASVPVHGC